MGRIRIACLCLFVAALWPRDLPAQNLLIANARILDGSGRVIERGSVVVRNGNIAAVVAGPSPARGARVIDAGGRTVMPGFIDAHRHIIRGDPGLWLRAQAAARMLEFLEAGFTTVVSAGDPPDAILDLRRRVQARVFRGPRLFAAGRVPLAQPGPASGDGGAAQTDPARANRSRPPFRPTTAAGAIPPEETVNAVEAVARAGFDYIKTAILVTPDGPEQETLARVVQEGKKHNLPTIAHAVSVEDTLAAVEAGVARLVHTPHIGRLEDDLEAVQKIAGAGIPMTSTLAVFLPHFPADNTPLFRDRLPFPWDTISSGGQGPVNARLLWQAGITYGYGTDTDWHPRESLADELRALQLMFSPKDIVTILTKNAAIAAVRGEQIGTLEVGKIADIVMVNGDPLRDVSTLLNVVMVIRGGEIAFDKRQ